MQAMLDFHDVSHVYQGSSKKVTALERFDLSVEAGEPVAIIGPSGSGKSTALLMAAGLLKPTTGTVMIAGEEVAKPRLQTALILQDFGLLPWKTVFENAALGLRIRKFSKNECLARANMALEQVGLLDFAKMYPSELSGGMRQRLALARTLALDVDVMLMDEPLSALDALLREGLQDLLLELWQRRAYAQVLVTHSIEEAVYLGKRILIMSQRPGHVVDIIDNPQMGSGNYRGTEAFYQTCQKVRASLRATTDQEVEETP